MSYDLKRNLGLKPTNRHFTGQSSVGHGSESYPSVAEIEQEGERLSFEPAVRFGHFELDREINNLPLAKPARKHTNSGIENARVTKHRREARRTAHWRHTIKLEASQPHADHFRFVVETKTAVCLVAIP